MKLSHDTAVYLIGTLAVFGIISSTYLYVQNKNKEGHVQMLQQQNDAFQQELNNKNAELTLASSTISKLKEEQEDLKKDLEDLADDYKDEKDKNDDFEDQIRDLAGTLGDLDKLSKIDEELLAKYSKVYFLNENYRPKKLTRIDDDYVLEGKKDQYFQADAIKFLEDMFDAAADDGIDLKVISAYRSFDEQTELKGQFEQVYGEGANAFSADQGYSEHQLGTTLDLTVKEIGGTYLSFKDTEAYQWLLDNAYKYGFILSYSENNDFYIYEPWHWRFVGKDLARYLNKSDETFYTMEQRDINEYLLELFD